MQDESIRAFFAIKLDEKTKNQICDQIADLKKTCPLQVRWVKSSQLHLTLRFLGNVRASQLDDIYSKLDSLSELPAFDMELQQLIALPIHKPRVIGIGVSLSNELSTLVTSLEQQLNEMGVEPEERMFMPHITLGRIAKPRRKSLLLDLIDVPRKQHVTNITLYKSQLTPDGSVYTILKEFPLKMGV